MSISACNSAASDAVPSSPPPRCSLVGFVAHRAQAISKISTQRSSAARAQFQVVHLLPVRVVLVQRRLKILLVHKTPSTHSHSMVPDQFILAISCFNKASRFSIADQPWGGKGGGWCYRLQHQNHALRSKIQIFLRLNRARADNCVTGTSSVPSTSIIFRESAPPDSGIAHRADFLHVFSSPPSFFRGVSIVIPQRPRSAIALQTSRAFAAGLG